MTKEHSKKRMKLKPIQNKGVPYLLNLMQKLRSDIETIGKQMFLQML